ncbi:MAG: hypothetical protein ABIP10_11020 [Ferruginibacter sp.]
MATIKTTTMIPVHIPALNIPPITSQLDKNVAAIAKKEKSINEFFFILLLIWGEKNDEKQWVIKKLFPSVSTYLVE